jgi:IS5 family transposase
MMCNAERPPSPSLTGGQAHDRRSADDMLGSLADGQILIGDRAYDSDARRRALAERGARARASERLSRGGIDRKKGAAWPPFSF